MGFLLAALAALVAFTSGRRGGAAGAHQGETGEELDMVDQDWDHLDPTFAAALRVVFRELEARGWRPFLVEGYRSPERQAELLARGKTTVRWSYHNYERDGRPAALAADVADRTHGWNNVDFFDDLATFSSARGMESGHYWRRFLDSAHVQAAPSKMLSAIRQGADPSPYLAALDAISPVRTLT